VWWACELSVVECSRDQQGYVKQQLTAALGSDVLLCFTLGCLSVIALAKHVHSWYAAFEVLMTSPCCMLIAAVQDAVLHVHHCGGCGDAAQQAAAAHAAPAQSFL
jgi:hypothetical protein